MTDARWARVKALFQAAVEQPVAERAAFLAAAAGGDETLRREVESLLASDKPDAALTQLLHQGNGQRVNAADRFSSSGETRAPTPASGRASIGPYQIVTLLGAGGMGEVFRARDSKLNRDVALKLLPEAVQRDPDRLSRFRREARALAALNHPHVAAIYGLEESGGRPALVLELVEGVTLADRIGDGPLTVREALALAAQIAAALEAAHEKGIVHRDLKPANIKVTPAGVVKVLDFGLAKTAAAERAILETVHPSADDDRTRLGAVLGTAAYMSPEQARGLPVDTRADIWAFGCVLFEMLSGRRAFGAAQGADATAAVLVREPDWAALSAATPAAIRALLRRCLEQDPAKRLPTIGEARAAIERLVMRDARRAATRLAIAGVVALSLAAAAAVYVWRQPTQRTTMADWIQLTNLDSVTQPTLSPDGRMLAFLRGPSTFVSPGQLYVKLLPDGEPVALTQDALPKMGPVFSPDGSRVAYTVNDGGSWDTWEVATLRGAPRLWLKNASGLAWLDSERLVFSAITSGLHMTIVRSTSGGAARQDLYAPAHRNAMAHRSYPSPDRRWVLVVEMDENSLWIRCRLISLEDRTSRQVGPAGRCTAAGWSPDGRWMYFTADAGDGFHVWRQRFPSGEPQQVTFGPTEEEGLAVAPDGRSLITSVGLSQRSVWVHDGTGERQVSLEGYAYWPLLSTDGQKLTFRVTRGVGSGLSPSELWVADLRSGTRQQWLPGRLVTGYDLSRDDRVVAAVRRADGRDELWLGPLDGREPPRPIAGAEGDTPRFGRGGEIIFRVVDGTDATVHRIAEDGSGRVALRGASGTALGTISPDGGWLSSVSADSASVSLYSAHGLAPVHVLPYTQASRMRWSADGRHAYISVQYGAASAFATGRTYVLPVTDGSVLPNLPPGGFRTEAELAAWPGVTVIPHGDVALGQSPQVYAFSRVTTTRNLYRIPVQ